MYISLACILMICKGLPIQSASMKAKSGLFKYAMNNLNYKMKSFCEDWETEKLKDNQLFKEDPALWCEFLISNLVS
jgi:hypothetical protein